MHETQIINMTKPVSSQKNILLLKRLQILQRVFLALVGLITVPILLGWTAPLMGNFLPVGWGLMKANTALCALLTAAAIMLNSSPSHPKWMLAGNALGLIIMIISGSALVGHITGTAFPIETLLAKDELSSMPGRMSLQTALFFTMMGFTAFCEGVARPFCSVMRDMLYALLIMLTLMVISGYLFGALALFSKADDIHTSPQTLACMILLVIALLVLRTQRGYFAILSAIGIGSQISRIAAPLVLLLPFLIMGSSAWLSHRGLSLTLASAITASISSAILFVVLVWLSQKINLMENELRDISLIDDLTKVRNRRGFYLIGEHMLFEAQRDNRPLTVLFFDLDGLKTVNDSLGHDIGSDLLKHFATLLQEHFRKSDVVARLGGDEFAVVSSSGDTQIALKRLERVITAINKAGKRPYNLSFSVGGASFSASSSAQNFNEIVAAADASMYRKKHAKKMPTAGPSIDSLKNNSTEKQVMTP